jgi:MFS family permease
LATPPAPSRPYHVLRHRDFRLLWGSQLVSLTGSQMQVVALNWHIYLLTGSPLALGLVGLTRVVPVIVFSLWGGIVADRFDRRRVMLISQSAMAVFSTLLALLTFRGHASLGVLYALNAATGAASAFDNPARQSLVPRLIPPKDLASALALNLVMFHAAFIGGPGLAGLLLAGGGA